MSYEVETDYWDGLGEFWECWGNQVLAWAELPEPYKVNDGQDVDAIPVEWIKNFIKRTNDTDGMAVAEMLSDWETENE